MLCCLILIDSTSSSVLQNVKKEVQMHQSKPVAAKVAQAFEEAKFIEALKKKVEGAASRFLVSILLV